MSLNGYLAKLRREFEYSIVEGPPAGESSEAAALGRSADGIILVLEAHRTRRAVARKIKATLDAADVRVLGMVLTGRRFPIPEVIYRGCDTASIAHHPSNTLEHSFVPVGKDIATASVVASQADGLVADRHLRLLERSRRILTHYDKTKAVISIQAIANSLAIEIRGYQLELV
jgi:hypothetical protein